MVVSRFLLFAGLGLAPLWVSSAIVILGSRHPSAGSEYWNAAPWLIVFAIPVCAVTLVIASVTYAIARRTQSASLPNAVLLAGLVVSCALVWNFAPADPRKISADEEQRLAERFVEQHPDVARVLRARSTAHVTRTSTRWGKPALYDVEIAFYPRQLTARVAVSRPDGRPRFELECMISAAQLEKLGIQRCDD